MRFMVIVKATPESESGAMPTEQDFAEMGNFNQELVDAGVMLSGEGLLPSAKGFKINFDGKSPTVIDGPFTEAKELVAGFWIIQVASREEAVRWMSRVPFREGEIEVRQIAEAEDFGEEFTPELRDQEDRQRAAMADRQK